MLARKDDIDEVITSNARVTEPDLRIDADLHRVAVVVGITIDAAVPR